MILLRKVSSAESSVTLGTTYIRRIYWYNPATIADTVVLQDGSGNEVITLRCEVANQSQLFDWGDGGLRLNGSKLSTLASGSVYLYT